MRGAVLQMALVALALGSVGAAGQEAQTVAPDTAMEARVWLDRGDDPVLERGDRVRVYYRVNADAYVALFHIDTDGSATLLYPRSPGEDAFARADRDYRLLFPSSSYWYVDEYPGKGYFFLVASSEPLDFDDYGYSSYDHAWDLTQVGQTVYTDPYVAMDDHVSHLIPDWQSVPYALDFTSYDVGQAHDYPRFMCYQCHGYRSYTAWNPYTYGCSAVRVVIWDDPYFSPTRRYAGTRVVLARARFGVPRYQFEKRGPGASWTPVRRTRQPSSLGPHYLEPGAAAGVRPDASQPRRAVPRGVPGAVQSPTPSSRAPRTVAPKVAPERQVGPRDDGVIRGAPTERRARPAVAPPKASNERPTLLRRPTGVLAPRSGGERRGAGSGATSSGRRGTVKPPTSGRPTTVTPRQPTRTVTPPPRPALRPRPRTTSGGGGHPVARPPRTSGGGGHPVVRPRRTGGGGGGMPSRAPVHRGGG